METALSGKPFEGWPIRQTPGRTPGFRHFFRPGSGCHVGRICVKIRIDSRAAPGQLPTGSRMADLEANMLTEQGNDHVDVLFPIID